MSDYYSVTSGGGPWLDNWLQNHVRVNLVCEGDPEALLENRHSAFWIDSELTLRTARLFLSVWLVGTPDGGLMDLLRAPRRTPPGRTGFIPSSLIHTLSWPYVSCIHFSCEPARRCRVQARSFGPQLGKTASVRRLTIARLMAAATHVWRRGSEHFAAG